MRIYNNMGVTYEELGQLDTSIYYCRKALNISTSEDSKAQLCLNIARIFNKKNISDSARYYLDKAEPFIELTDNIYVKTRLANSYYLIEQSAGNYKKALEYFKLYSNLQVEILDNNDRKLLLEMQKKYDLTVKENEYIKARSRFWKTIVILCCILLILAVVSIYALFKKAKTELEKIELEKTLQQLQTLHEMCNIRDNKMKTLFLKKMDTFKKMAILNPYFKGIYNDENIKTMNYDVKNKLIKETKIIVQSLNSQNFVDIANELSPGFTVRLKEINNQLTEREISMCCLILFGFKNIEIDVLLNNRLDGTSSNMENLKSSIKRKLGIVKPRKFREFLLKNIK